MPKALNVASGIKMLTDRVPKSVTSTFQDFDFNCSAVCTSAYSILSLSELRLTSCRRTNIGESRLLDRSGQVRSVLHAEAKLR
jgi:hypothetical protein